MLEAEKCGSPVISFDTGIPENIKVDSNSTISINHKHYKFNKNSLQWDFKKGSYMILNTKIGFEHFVEGSLDQARHTFGIWIYSEKPINERLVFQFGSGDKIDCWCYFNLNFRGWRTAWIAFERDMEGTPQNHMDKLIIKAPDNVEEGTIYINQIILSSPVDPRHPTRDFQVPYVNLEADEMANSHWLSLYRFSKLKPQYGNDENCEYDFSPFNLISKRYEEYVIKKQEVNEDTMKELREKYNSYNIICHGENIGGNCVGLNHNFHIYPKHMRKEIEVKASSIEVNEYVTFMLNIAQSYHSARDLYYKNELKDMFIKLQKHLLEQGFAEGSSFGTSHHLGYNLRNYWPAVFLMSDVIREAGLLEESQKAIDWYTGLGRIYIDFNEIKGMSMDTFNTQLQGMLVSILLMENSTEKAKYMFRFSEWLNHCLMPAPGIEGPIKIDGSVYHHANHYPAYAVGGFLGITPVVYFLSGTCYRIAEEGHGYLKKAVLAMRLYCNKYQWLVSLSSRHPNGKGEHSSLDILPFKYMALSGTPDGKCDIDYEVASAYLRLVEGQKEDAAAEMFKKNGITSENAPQGHWTMNYAALAIHRREDWLVGARGHSRYIWANETYVDANLYGRYITHGNVQIMCKGNPVNNEDSGYVKEGFDWNHWPGTTAIRLPFHKLRSEVRNVDTFSGFEEMLISDETFAGGLNTEGKNGMFAMKLHEHPKYEGTHRANKSVFFFDNRIILLGSDIENENKEYPTDTTLFQNHLSSSCEPMWVNSFEKITGLNYSKSITTHRNMWIVDNKENGYYIPAAQNISIHRKTQCSKSHKNDEDTKGDFASAWIEHGKAPKNKTYEYAIVVKTNAEEMVSFTEKMSNVNTAFYTVLQKDKNAHIVKDNLSNTTGYALFEANHNINKGLILAVDTPSMVMTKETEEALVLSVCDPDLRLYSGIEEDQYDKQGNRIEVSLYSRKWRDALSQESTLMLTIKGKWILKETGKQCKIKYSDDEKTTLEFVCRNAVPIEISLRRI